LAALFAKRTYPFKHHSRIRNDNTVPRRASQSHPCGKFPSFDLDFAVTVACKKTSYICSTIMFKPWPAIGAALLSFALGIPTCAYDVPLTESSIRDAYFLGIRNGGLKPDFLAKYVASIPELKQGTCTSQARIETPFLQIALFSGKSVNYSAQDAVEDFYGKPAAFLVYLDVCYRQHAPANAVTVKILQNKKEVVPVSFESSPYSEPTEFGFLPPNGEQIVLEFAPSKIDSSDLTILIDTPNGQHVSTDFDLQSIR
jgi:hypothetical protein